MKRTPPGERPLIALDADGVLLDYNLAYASAWQRAFGERPTLVAPQAYRPMDRWGVARLEGERLQQLRACFDERFWSTIPAVAGAVQACHALADAGHRLVCVSALAPRFARARWRNLRDLGLPIERLLVVGEPDAHDSAINPKAAAVAAIAPAAMVDDYLPYLLGLPAGVHAALVLREPMGSPNAGEGLQRVHSQHADLAGFARWWLSDEQRASRASLNTA